MFWLILLAVVVVIGALMWRFDRKHPGALRDADRRVHRDEPESKGFDRYGRS